MVSGISLSYCPKMVIHVSPKSRGFQIVTVWIHIQIELYNTKFPAGIGAVLSIMLKIDKKTSIHSRDKFASICVDIDLKKPLVSFIMISGYRFPFEYEGLLSICFICGEYGHKIESCIERVEITTSLKPHALGKTQGEDPTLQILPDLIVVANFPK